MGYIDGAEVAKHNNKKDCWIVLDSKAYDVTSFLKEHPGGAPIILKNAGTDATEAFKKYHPLSYLNDYISPDAFKGVVDPNTFAQLRQIKPEQSKSPSSTTENSNEVPHVSMNVVTTDFEKAAKAVLPHKSYVFASTSSNNGLALKGNVDDWSRISFRPRILRDVGEVDTRRTILGHNSPIPYYLSPMGTMGSIHPGAEPEMYKAAVQKGIHAVVSGASSKTSEQIMESFLDEQRKIGNQSPSKLHFQFYIPVDRNKAIEIMRTAKKAGYKGLWITVDAPVLGKRTTDRYLQAEEALSVGLEEESASEWEVGSENPTAPAVGGRAPPGQLSPHTTFKDLSWIRKEWDGPIILKGVQCAEDAKLAMEYGCQGVLLSNHGGRQLHTAPSALMTLCEIRTYCPEVFSKLEVFVDGGLRDGNDILKALCLGATAVGVGRPFLYALGAYGSKGVERCVDILTEELQTGMRLLGITSLDQCRPELVNATRLLNEMWRPDQFNIKSRL